MFFSQTLTPSISYICTLLSLRYAISSFLMFGIRLSILSYISNDILRLFPHHAPCSRMSGKYLLLPAGNPTTK